MKDLSIGLLNDVYGKCLTEKQSDILKSYFDYDMSLSEISETYGISRQAAFDAIKKGEKSLIELENNIGYLNRTTMVKTLVKEISIAVMRGDNDEAILLLQKLESDI